MSAMIKEGIKSKEIMQTLRFLVSDHYYLLLLLLLLLFFFFFFFIIIVIIIIIIQWNPANSKS